MFRFIYSIQWFFNHLSLLTAIFSLLLLAFSLLIFQKKWSHWLWLFVLPCLFLSSLAWYGSAIEVYNLQTNYTTIKTGFKSKFVLISDTHLGVWKKQDWVKKIIDRINQESNVQAILIAGDLTYEAEKQDLVKLFAPFKNSKVPVYAVLGNHDIEVPGRNYKPDIFDILESSGIEVLENRKTKLFKVDNKLISDKKIKPEMVFDSKNYIWLVGFADFWDKKTTIDLSVLDDLQDSDKVLAIAHNPDTVDIYKDKKVDLTLSGHTHCGQVRILNYYDFIPTKGNYDKGLYETKNGKVFVTCGVGESGAPIRLNNPPTIDVITTE